MTWHLMIFDKKTELLVAEIALNDAQTAALRPYLGIVDTDDQFGIYPVIGLDWFADEHSA